MVYYMWNKTAMQVLIQAMSADSRIIKKYGEYNKTYTEYGIDKNDAKQASMKRFALAHTLSDQDAQLMLKNCAHYAINEYSMPYNYIGLAFLLMILYFMHSMLLHIFMPLAILIFMYIYYFATCKKKRLRKIWAKDKDCNQPEQLYDTLLFMEHIANKPTILHIPFETLATAFISFTYLIWAIPGILK